MRAWYAPPTSAMRSFVSRFGLDNSCWKAKCSRMCCRRRGRPNWRRTVHGAVIFGQHRTLQQDIEFAFAQLSEIAIRALSPAINDTYTGLSCIDWLGDALRMLVSFPVSDGAWRTRGGQIRVLVPPVHISAHRQGGLRSDPRGRREQSGGDDPDAADPRKAGPDAGQ